MKQVRKIKPTRRSISGHVSFKGQPIAFESSLERDFLIYHCFKEEVLDIVPQPICIPFKKNGRTYPYTPDFFVQRKDGSGKSLIVEVKPKDEWQKNWREWSDKWKATIRYCKEHEFKFAIYDEDRIRHKALENINFIMRYKNIAVIQEEVDAVLFDISNRGNTRVDYILERYFKSALFRDEGKRLLWYLMANKVIGFNEWDDVRSEQLEVWYGQ